jgi:hypothetical protein
MPARAGRPARATDEATVHDGGRELPAGTLLVGVRADGRGWARQLPQVPDGRTLTVTVGHPSLAPVPADDLVAGGYRIVGVAADHRPLGHLVDVCVPPELRTAHPDWWVRMVELADRVFDPRLGPVARVLAAELDLHRRAAGSS